jgi:YNFM family putative membrane transporter
VPGAEADDLIERGTAAFVRTNLALFAAGFATFALLYYVQALMPVFSTEFGVSPAAASLSLSLSTGLMAVSMLIASSLSEVWGRKPVMMLSLLLSSLLTVAAAALPSWPALLAGRAAMGITLAGLPAVAMAYVSEEMHPKSMGFAMGLYIGGSGLGGMSGRLLTGVLTDLFGWRAAVMALGIAGLVSAALVWRGLPASRHFVPRELRPRALLSSLQLHLRDPALRLLFVEGFLLMGSFVTIYNYAGYRLLAPPFSLSQTGVGLIFTIYLFGIFSSTGMGTLAGRLGRRRVLTIALAVMLAGTLITLSGRLWLLIGGIAVMTIGFFGGHSIASSWVGARASQAKAQASSLYLFSYYVGSSIVGSLGGVFWSALGWPGIVGLTGTLVALALAVTLLLARAV